MIVLGLTGSIGMGKSTTATMFREAGIPVWDADATVHALYGRHAAGTEVIARLAPDAVGPQGVDRTRLRAAVLADPTLLERIETVIFPLVGADRTAFLDRCRDQGQALVLCDIPLLFETGADTWLDKVLVVSASPETQRQRVMARDGMTEEMFAAILAKQVPDAEKRRRADFVIETDHGMDAARRDVVSLIEALTGDGDA